MSKEYKWKGNVLYEVDEKRNEKEVGRVWWE